MANKKRWSLLQTKWTFTKMILKQVCIKKIRFGWVFESTLSYCANGCVATISGDAFSLTGSLIEKGRKSLTILTLKIC
jgi:hypothetical protein